MEGGVVRAFSSRMLFHLWRIGPAGVAGLALLVAVAAFHGFVLPQQRAALAMQEADSEQLRRQYQRAVQDARAGRPDTREALVRLYAQLKGIDEMGTLLQGLQRAAAENGLRASSAEYKLIRDKDSGMLAEYQVVLPLKGSYRELRGFVRQVLAQVPGAALIEFNVRRDSIVNPELDARLRFALYLKAGA